MTQPIKHSDRPWWKRRAFWFITLGVALVVIVVAVFEQIGKPAAVPYSAFLDQLDAGNVASLTFQATEISGRFKRPSKDRAVNNVAQDDTFRSRVPDFGDPALIPELHKQHVKIDVVSSASWTRLLAGLPWPMLLFVGAMLIAGLVRLVRGGKGASGPTMPTHPMQGMMGLISGLFAKQEQAAGPPPPDGDRPQEQKEHPT
jgi:hypothetical protein